MENVKILRWRSYREGYSVWLTQFLQLQSAVHNIFLNMYAFKFQHLAPNELRVTRTQAQRKTFKFLSSDILFEDSSVRLLSVNKAFSNSVPKSIIKSGCRQEGRGELKWGRETNGAPRCRLGCGRWGCKRDLMVGWIREILVTMLNNYGSSRDQSTIDWTPQAFSTQSLGKQRFVNWCSDHSGCSS